MTEKRCWMSDCMKVRRKEDPITPTGWRGNYSPLFLAQNGFVVWNGMWNPKHVG